MTKILAVFVQVDIPQDSAERTFVPLGITMRVVSVIANDGLLGACLPSTTALWIGKFPSIPTSHSDESDIFAMIVRESHFGRKWVYVHMYIFWVGSTGAVCRPWERMVGQNRIVLLQALTWKEMIGSYPFTEPTNLWLKTNRNHPYNHTATLRSSLNQLH